MDHCLRSINTAKAMGLHACLEKKTSLLILILYFKQGRDAMTKFFCCNNIKREEF